MSANSDIQYSGHWKVFGFSETYDGTLHYNEENKVLLLELTKPFDIKNPTVHMVESTKVPIICGVLFSGSRVALLDCFRTNTHMRFGGHVTELIYADYALWAFPEAECARPLFQGAVIDYGSIVEWADLSYYELDENSEHVGDQITWLHKDAIDLGVTGGLHLCFSPRQGSFSFLNYDNDVTIHQYVSTCFLYDEPRQWESAMDDANWLRRMIELGKGCPVSIRGAQYLHSSHLLLEKSGAEGPDHFMPAEVLLGTEQKEISQSRSRNWTYLFNLAEAVDCGSVSVWFNKRDDLEPVVDLYTLAYTDKIPSAMALFLNLTQALETYHARFVCNEIMVYKDRVEKLTSKSNSDDDLRNFLCDKGQRGSKKLYLKSRICDLLYADGRRPVSPRHMSLEDFVQKIVDTRNYYTHYDKDKKEKAFAKDELPTVNAELMALIEYHLMLSLGFDAGTAAEKIHRRLNDRIGA